MALRIGLNGFKVIWPQWLDVPVILQCRTPQETNPKGHWEPNYFLGKIIVFFPPWWSWYVLGPSRYALTSLWAGSSLRT